MMNLDEAIQHCEEVAEENEEIYEAHCRIYSKEVVERYPSPPCKKCAEEHRQLAEWLKELKAYKEQSGDAISRQVVQDYIARYLSQYLYDDVREAVEVIDAFIGDLPSVTPQQKMGWWIQKEEEGEAEPFIIWECSECHCVDEDGKPSYKYCPQCGAKMEV